MPIEGCPECEALWDEYKQCVANIRRFREAAQTVLVLSDGRKSRNFQAELRSLEKKSAMVRQNLVKHQSSLHRASE
jgi:hypothetical protein